MEMIQHGLLDHIFAFILCVLFPILATTQVRSQMHTIRFDTAVKRAVYISNSIVLWIGAVITLGIWFIYGRSFSDLGLRLPIKDAQSTWWILMILFVLIFAFDLIYELRNNDTRLKTLGRWKENTPFMPSTKKDLPWFLVLCISAGFCEELIFRGYLIQYFYSLDPTNGLFSLNIAVWLPAIIFAIVHIYQGKEAVIKIIIMAGLFGYVFVYSYSILALVVLHFLINFIQGIIGVTVLKFPASDEEE